MSMQATRAPLPGGRWHLQHGPIDIVLGADGSAQAVQAAHAAAWLRFQGVLAELVGELPLLRRPVRADQALTECPLRGPVAQRMWRACWPHRARFITPMAAVAGAVAQELIAHYARDGIDRAWVNNGGDIALHLTPGASLRVGLYADLTAFGADDAALAARGELDGDAAFTLGAERPVRGVATSGWRGRSFSLGIADSVTVLARTAAEADAAASIIANAVNVEAPGIVRRPARELRDDTDLGDIPVTVQVPRLPPALVRAALASGLDTAHALRAQGLIHDAALVCQGRLARLNDEVLHVLPGRRHRGQTPAPALVQ